MWKKYSKENGGLLNFKVPSVWIFFSWRFIKKKKKKNSWFSLFFLLERFSGWRWGGWFKIGLRETSYCSYSKAQYDSKCLFFLLLAHKRQLHGKDMGGLYNWIVMSLTVFAQAHYMLNELVYQRKIYLCTFGNMLLNFFFFGWNWNLKVLFSFY